MKQIEQKVSRGKLSLLTYAISGEQSANRPKQLRNDAFYVKTSPFVKSATETLSLVVTSL